MGLMKALFVLQCPWEAQKQQFLWKSFPGPVDMAPGPVAMAPGPADMPPGPVAMAPGPPPPPPLGVMDDGGVSPNPACCSTFLQSSDNFWQTMSGTGCPPTLEVISKQNSLG